MIRTKTKIDAPSTSSKDATRKRKKNTEKKNKANQVASVPLCENEAQGFQNNDVSDKDVVPMIPKDEISSKKTESLSTPKRERNLHDMETPEARTQTRLTLKYDDLLLSQTIDPQCEVSWECISPEVVQKVHKDIQRKPNLDVSKILALFTDEDDPPSNSSSNINSNTLLNIMPYVPCRNPYVSSNKKVPLKRKLKSSRKNTTSSEMEEMIRKLEMRIKNEAEQQMAEDSVNHKRTTNPPEMMEPLQNTSSRSQEQNYSNQNLTKKCLQDISEPTSSDTKTTTSFNQNLNICLLNNEDTSWSDDDLFCDESFISKVAQTSENKPIPKIIENKSSIFSEQLVIADKKTSLTCCKTFLGLKYTDVNKCLKTKTENNREITKSSDSPTIGVCNTDMNCILQQDNKNGINNLLQEDLDLGFSDSDTDELLSQLTEQEMSCAIKSSDKKLTKNNFEKKVPVIEQKNAVDSYLEFLDMSSKHCRKPSPGKRLMTDVPSTKKLYNFKSMKNNINLSSNISATNSVPSKQNIGPPLDSSFDDPFSDKDDDILRFAESLDTTEIKGQETKAELEIRSSYVPTSKQITPKIKTVCTKEEIERKKRVALNRRKKIGTITKCNLK